MIFKTFNSDIDKISSKLGIFGRSFYDIDNAISEKVNTINRNFQATDDLIASIKNSGSIWNRLYPSKESTQSQLIDVDFEYPEINKSNFDFNKYINDLNNIDKQVKAGTSSWQDYSDGLKESEQWIAKWGQATEGQIRTQEDMIKANQEARASALAQNEAIKNQTLSAKAGQVALQALATAGNMIAMWAISAVIQQVVSAIDQYIHRVEIANETMQAAVSQYQSAKSGLEQINSELKEQGSRMDELRSKGSLSYTEEDELARLQDITNELLIQKELQEKRTERASEEAAYSASEAFRTQYGDVTRANLQGLQASIEAGAAFITPANDQDIVGALATYLNSQKLLAEAENHYREALSSGQDTTWAESSLQSYKDMSEESRKILDQAIDDIFEKNLIMEEEYHKTVEKLSLSGETSLTSSEKDLLKSYEDSISALKMIYEYTDKSGWNKIEFSNLFNTKETQKIKEELIAMAKAGELTPETIGGFQNLNNALQDADLLLENNVTKAQALCDYIYSAFTASKESADAYVPFDIAAYKEEIDTVQSSVSTLRSALEALNSGSLNSTQVTDLLQQFPSLAPYIDLTAKGFGNLSEGLRTLIEQQPSSLINSLETLKGSLQTDPERKQVELLIDSLKHLSSYGNSGMEAYAQAMGHTWTDTQNVIEGVAAQFERLAKVQEAVSEGLTMTTASAAELAKIYPEILTNATVSADGQITLNEEVVKQILEGDQSAVQAQINRLNADKAVLEAKKSFAEAQLEILKQVGEEEGKISKEEAQSQLETANQKVQALIELGLEEDKAYAAVAASMAGNMAEYNRIVGIVGSDSSQTMINASEDMAQSSSENSTKAQESYLNLQNVIWNVADAVKGMSKGIRAGSNKLLGGAGSANVTKGIHNIVASVKTASLKNDANATSAAGKSGIPPSLKFNKQYADYQKKELLLEDFQSQLETDIKGYADAISNIDTQIDLLKNLQSTFTDTANSQKGGIGGHQYSEAQKSHSEKSELSNPSGPSAASSTSNSSEEIDWMERKNELLQNQRDLQQAIVNDEAASYEERISAIYNLIEWDKERAINAKQSAAWYRQAWEDSVKSLQPEDIAKIQNGGISMDTYEGAYADKIKEAIDLHDKMNDLKEKASQIEDEASGHLKEQLRLQNELIQARQEEINHNMEMVKARMELIEVRGGVRNEGMYRRQIALSKELAFSYEDQIEALREQMDQAEEGSGEYYSLLASVNNCERALLDCQKQQDEWNEAIKRLPAERIQSYLDELAYIKQDLQNFSDQRAAMGISTTKEQYQQFIDISEEQITKLLKQQEKLKSLLGNYSYGSEKFNSLSGEIQNIDNQISDLIQKQFEYNQAMLQIPVEKAQGVLDALDQARVDLDNYMAEQKALGKTSDIDQYRQLHTLAAERLKALSNQKALLTSLLFVYDKNSETYQDTVSQIQNVEDAISQTVQEQHKWNEEILNLPVDRLSEANQALSSYSGALGETLNSYDKAASAVSGILNRQVTAINDLKETAGQDYEARLTPLKEQLDLLKKTNEQKQIQNALEQAAYNQARAESQKTIQVIRDGEIHYEADMEAVRAANAEMADSQYNKIVYDLEAQMEALEEEREKLLGEYDREIEKLEAVKNKWSEITDQIQLAIDIQQAEQVLGKGFEDQILSGSDEKLYETFKQLYETASDQKQNADEAISSNERAASMMEEIVKRYRLGQLSYEEAVQKTAALSLAMKDGYTSFEYLDELKSMGIGKEFDGAAEADRLLKYLEVVKNQEQAVSGYGSTWKEVTASVTEQARALKEAVVSLNTFQSYLTAFQKNADAITKHTFTWEQMQKSVSDQIKALQKAAEELGRQDAINRGDKIVYEGKGARGYEEEDVRHIAENYQRLRPDEMPVLAKEGEAVITPQQWQTAVKNFETAISEHPIVHTPSPSITLPNRVVEKNVNVQFGDIVLPNATNPDSFVKALDSTFESSMRQNFSKVFSS